jgi:hypothetical protein
VTALANSGRCDKSKPAVIGRQASRWRMTDPNPWQSAKNYGYATTKAVEVRHFFV